jgi:hypothetical protein
LPTLDSAAAARALAALDDCGPSCPVAGQARRTGSKAAAAAPALRPDIRLLDAGEEKLDAELPRFS